LFCPALTKPRGFLVPNVSGNGFLERHIPVLRLPSLSKQAHEGDLLSQGRAYGIHMGHEGRGNRGHDRNPCPCFISVWAVSFNEERSPVKLGEAVARWVSLHNCGATRGVVQWLLASAPCYLSMFRGRGWRTGHTKGLLCFPGARERVTARSLVVAVDGAAPKSDLVSALHLMGDRNRHEG